MTAEVREFDRPKLKEPPVIHRSCGQEGNVDIDVFPDNAGHLVIERGDIVDKVVFEKLTR